MALHTYEFYRKRKNDPKWRDAYIEARDKRIISFLVTLIVLAVLMIIGILFYNYSTANGVTADNFNTEMLKGFSHYCVEILKETVSKLRDVVSNF